MPERAPPWRAWAAGGPRSLLAAAAIGLLCFTLARPPEPLLVWNASASMPEGLYLVLAGSKPKRGDVVIAALAPGPRRLADAREYLPAAVPVVKRIAAVGGDRVCAPGADVFVNGRLAARRLHADGAGRPLAWWQGCEVLSSTVLLLGNDPASYDGRYFGPLRSDLIMGKARLLWPR